MILIVAAALALATPQNVDTAAEPTGTRILFALVAPGGKPGLQEVKPDGTGLRSVAIEAHSARGEYQASRSPDGRWIGMTTYHWV